MKITIIGPSSSGKSTLARKISAEFNIPRLEIDRLWFSHGGHTLMQHKNPTEAETQAVRQKLEQDVEQFLTENNAWVSDGTYHRVQPKIAREADVVIYIQRPVYRRVWSHLKRIFQSDHRHPETTRWGDVLFTRTIIRRWLTGENNKVNELSNAYKDKLVVLKSFQEIDDYFASLLTTKTEST